jgi:hypothetical protein
MTRNFSQQQVARGHGPAQLEYRQAKSHKRGIYTIDRQEAGDESAMEAAMEDAMATDKKVDKAARDTDFRRMAKVKLHGISRWLYTTTVTRSSLKQTNACRKKIWLKKESNEEKTTARYVSWFMYFINSKVPPERHFALPSWHRSYRTFTTSPRRRTPMCGNGAKRQDASEKTQGESDGGFE